MWIRDVVQYGIISRKGENRMKKKVLIISSSLKPDSNSHALCEEVAKGVESAGGEAQVVRLLGKKIVDQE